MICDMPNQNHSVDVFLHTVKLPYVHILIECFGPWFFWGHTNWQLWSPQNPSKGNFCHGKLVSIRLPKLNRLSERFVNWIFTVINAKCEYIQFFHWAISFLENFPNFVHFAKLAQSNILKNRSGLNGPATLFMGIQGAWFEGWILPPLSLNPALVYFFREVGIRGYP